MNRVQRDAPASDGEKNFKRYIYEWSGGTLLANRMRQLPMCLFRKHDYYIGKNQPLYNFCRFNQPRCRCALALQHCRCAIAKQAQTGIWCQTRFKRRCIAADSAAT